MCGHISDISAKFCGQNCLLSIASQHIKHSLLNQAAWTWVKSAWGTFLPSRKTPNCVDFYCNDWILPAKFHLSYGKCDDTSRMADLTYHHSRSFYPNTCAGRGRVTVRSKRHCKKLALLIYIVLILLWLTAQHSSLVVDALVVVVPSVLIVVFALVLLLLIFSLIVTIADFWAIRACALAAIGVDHWLRGGGAILGVVNLPSQPVHAHALLRGHLIGSHLQWDSGVVHWLQSNLLVIDVPPGAWGRHTSLKRDRHKKNMSFLSLTWLDRTWQSLSLGVPGWLLYWCPFAGWWWSGRRVSLSVSWGHKGVSWSRRRSYQPGLRICWFPSETKVRNILKSASIITCRWS